jgi:hypothetical protein
MPHSFIANTSEDRQAIRESGSGPVTIFALQRADLPCYPERAQVGNIALSRGERVIDSVLAPVSSPRYAQRPAPGERAKTQFGPFLLWKGLKTEVKRFPDKNRGKPLRQSSVQLMLDKLQLIS